VTPQHRFLLKLHLKQIDHLDEAMAAIGSEIEANLKPFRIAVDLVSTAPGIASLSARAIVSEIGTDMSRFPSEGHLLSWAGLCPRNDESAGKRRSTRLRRCAMAQDHVDPVRLGSQTQKRELFASSIPAREQSSGPISDMGLNPNPSLMLACQLPPVCGRLVSHAERQTRASLKGCT
jgi:hypothetical protein